MELLLGKYRNKHSTDVDNYVGLNLSQEERLIHNDTVSDTIDQFQQYMAEKDKSNKYRLTFTIMPVCSNVLFNAITEVVYMEGHWRDCQFFGDSGKACDSWNVEYYHTYKDLEVDKIITRHDAIEDTSYSHHDIGPFVYHCGFDIFNNHTLRAKEFTVINKLGNTAKTNFNTIKDYIRDRNGKRVSDYLIGTTIGNMKSRSGLRLYSYDTVRSFSDSITENLTEKDGWFGFINPCGIDVNNVTLGSNNICVNKCMNNNKACEFIDMYPDRSLFSFIPKVNKYQERIEPNWDYCLTYPYSAYTNSIVEDANTKVNGLECIMVSSLSDVTYYESNTDITFRTNVKHNLSYGDIIGLTIISNGTPKRITNTITVSGVGLDGYDGNYYFSVKFDSIEEYFDELGSFENQIRVCRIINGKDCQYYFRVFKRIPNFKDTNVNADSEVTDSDIRAHCLDGFDSALNKVAFERSIYNDNAVQIIFNDDIDLTGLRDNLGREVSEVFLTLVKNNDGYKAWYNSKRYAGSDITFSHCFGKLTAGLDCPAYVHDYNVHKIHNVRVNDTNSIQANLKKTCLLNNLNIDVDNAARNLEEERGEITVRGDSFFSNNGEFLGDIVEFSPYEYEERVIEDVYFRFNTAQRENTDFNVQEGDNMTVSGEYANLRYDEINYDDYDSVFANGGTANIDSQFLSARRFNEITKYNKDNVKVGTEAYPANVFPEGYYYKPHYRMKVREYNDEVNVGAHTRVDYDIDYDTPFENCGLFQKARIKTRKNYYFQVNDTVYLYHKGKDRTKDLTTTCCLVEGDNFEYVTINIPSSFTETKLKEYNVYRHNSEKPKYARELNDGTGRYIWRTLKKEINIMTDSELYDSVFMNGAHYYHKNINFFLRRQDPVCEYGLSYCDGVNSRVLKLVIDGKHKDVTPYEFVETDENVIC